MVVLIFVCLLDISFKRHSLSTLRLVAFASPKTVVMFVLSFLIGIEQPS